MSGLAADLVRLLHAAYVGILLAAPLLLIGAAIRDIAWLATPLVRRLHIGCLLFVIVQFAWDLPCPLTQLEIALRGAAEGTVYLQGWASLPVGMRNTLVFIGTLYVVASVVGHLLAGRAHRQTRDAVSLA